MPAPHDVIVSLAYEQRIYQNFFNELMLSGYDSEEIDRAWQKIVTEFKNKKRHSGLGAFVRNKINQAKRGVYEL